MRATVERHEKEDVIPPIIVDIVKGKADLTIRIKDLGGGIPRSKIYDLFAYHYSTAPEPDHHDGMAPLVSPRTNSLDSLFKKILSFNYVFNCLETIDFITYYSF